MGMSNLFIMFFNLIMRRGGEYKKALVSVACGLTGGITILRENGEYSYYPMPREGKELDSKTLYTLLLEGKDIVIEEQFLIKEQTNQVANMTIGKNYGVILGLARVTGAEVHIIHPRVWQRGYIFCPPTRRKTKKDHIVLAHSLGMSKNIKLDGIADAFLISKYFEKISRIKAKRK
jgi:hypothetical protein